MYIPKNRIKTDLYTNGGELQYLISGEVYQGFYWETFQGRFFTGKNPNEKPQQELVKLPENRSQFESDSLLGDGNYVAYAENYDGEVFDGQFQNMESVNDYHKIKKIKWDITLQLPTPYYPKPTEEEYTLGVFQRYFCTKINEVSFVEVSKKEYEKFKNRQDSVAHQSYGSFQIPWTLTGNADEVEQTNRKIVLLAEQRTKSPGLQQFLKFNYLKFYKS